MSRHRIGPSDLPRHPGVSGWVAMLPPRTPAPALAGAIRADIAVIGAGLAGLAAARRLAQIDPGLRVAVLEAGIVGDGPAGRNSGFIIDLPHEVSSEDYGGAALQKSRDRITLQRRAVDFAVDLARERGWPREVLDLCGRYNVAMTPEGDRHIRDYAAKLDELGEPYRLLDRAGIADVTGSQAFSSAIHMPGTAIVQPAAYIRGLADTLGGNVTLYEGSPAMALEPRGTAWLVRTPAGSVEAGRIILANNGHAERFGFFRGRLLHVYTYASMTETFSPNSLGGMRDWAATPASPMGTTLRRVSGPRGDRLLVRSRYTYNPGMNVGAGTLRRAGHQHDRKFAHRFPGLADLRMEYRWGGAMALTWNSVPAWGEVEKGIFAACGCNGVGATNATASGLAAAEQMLDVPTELTRIYRGFATPQRLPPQPFTLIGAKTTLALRERRAGIE
ncbi:Glycine/D-amino acid oxidase [Paracoccus halophilus]|uniref:Glycine/D-amino acid oxidase n=1 Tax=Paracoccus halophilus TaxID=376733 RepID=A0A099EV28_9RHOB|nr:FAD-binding oxidoreductase [Paracoccus halophilus]KGJ02250.1 oxidoreductase [Paracoccus halophilus]SFA61675.1 Glycine/D-amino acid oxidase [Paracoccus halophilus]